MLTLTISELIIGQRYSFKDKNNKIFNAEFKSANDSCISLKNYVDTNGMTRLHESLVSNAFIEEIKIINDENIKTMDLNFLKSIINAKQIIESLIPLKRYFLYYKEHHYEDNVKYMNCGFNSSNENNIYLINCINKNISLGSACLELNRITKIITLYDIIKNENKITKDLWLYIGEFL